MKKKEKKRVSLQTLEPSKENQQLTTITINLSYTPYIFSRTVMDGLTVIIMRKKKQQKKNKNKKKKTTYKFGCSNFESAGFFPSKSINSTEVSNYSNFITNPRHTSFSNGKFIPGGNKTSLFLFF